MLLGRKPQPFDDPDYLFELKYDGFRSLAVVRDGECKLVSRNGNEFKSFENLRRSLPSELRVSSAIMDGEIVCLDQHGKPNFNDLFYRHREPIFVAFDVLRRGDEDLRYLPLCDRKQELRRILKPEGEWSLYCSHIEERGASLFRLAADNDLEGIVAKLRKGKYTPGRDETTWYKIRNRNYSQWEGRSEMFDRPEEPTGWGACAMAATAQ
jgi:bifunctional non-homologous end joining protein LigD